MSIRIIHEWPRRSGRSPRIEHVSTLEAHSCLVADGAVHQSDFEDAIIKAESGRTTMLACEHGSFYFEAIRHGT